MFDLVSQSIRLKTDGFDKELDSKDIGYFREKVNEMLRKGWKLEQFSSSEVDGILLFVQTFTK